MPLLRKGLWQAGAGLLLLVLVAGSLLLARDLYFYPSPPTADYPPATDTLTARVQDVDYFRHYLTLDRSYTAESRAAAEAMLETLPLDSLSDAQFQLAIARAVAVADNGHSNIWLGRFSLEFGRAPFRLYWFDDGLFVVSAAQDNAELLGGRLTHVGGVAVAEVSRALQVFAGGSDEGYRAYRGPGLLELPAALNALGFADSEKEARYRFELSDGRTIARTLAAVAIDPEQPIYWPRGYLLANLAGSLPDWVGVVPAQPPLYLQEPERDFRVVWISEQDTVFVQFRRNSDGTDETIADFSDRVRDTIEAHRPRFIVVDHRFNGGGDYTTTAGLMTDLPGLLPDGGRLYLLTGNATFSAGINSVAFARAAAPDRVTIVGARIGDPERTWGETNSFELPNSRLGITFSTGLHDVANGCYEWPECYWTNYFFNVATGSLDPDYPVGIRFSDYVAGRDPVLEKVWALAGDL